MRKLTGFLVVLAILWCSYWAAGNYAIGKGAALGLAEAARNGTVYTAPTVQTAGFPTAFEVALRGIDLGDPVSGVRWQTPGLRLRAAMWQPWHVVALLDDSHQIILQDQNLSLAAKDARASLTASPNHRLTLTQAAVTVTQPILASSLGWRIEADIMEVHANLLPDLVHSYRLVFDAANLRPDPALMLATGLGSTVSVAEFTAIASLSAPVDLVGMGVHPALTRLALKQLRILWDSVEITAEGEIVADAAGLASGRIDIRIAGWRTLVAAAVGAGAITSEMAPRIEGLLGAMAAQGGDPDVLALPLVFANGRGNLGPLPLGPAPSLRSAVAN